MKFFALSFNKNIVNNQRSGHTSCMPGNFWNSAVRTRSGSEGSSLKDECKVPEIISGSFFGACMYRYTLFVLLGLMVLFTGCTSRYSDFFPYYDNGTKKPSIVLLPVAIDSKSLKDKDPFVDSKILRDPETCSRFCETLTKSIRNRVKRKGTIYAPPEVQMKKILQNVSLDALSEDTSLALFKKFQGSDYVCLMELVDISLLPYKRGAFTPLYFAQIDPQEAKVLSLAVRMKIVDIRPTIPKIVRQELIQSNHMVLAPVSTNDKERIQSRLSRDMAKKVEDLLCLKK
jgi:hypothetical protein